MKKLTLALSLLTVLGAASCKKDDDKKSANSWTVGGKTYTVMGASVSGGTYSFSGDGGKATVMFSFKTAPTASGTFKVENNEVNIITGTSDPVTIGSVDAGDVVVTVNGEEVNIKCSGLTVEQTDMAGTKLDNTTLTADVTY